jgi:hypothetical protein
MFQRLLEHDIKFNSNKTFLKFSSMTLLDQHVNDLDLHAVKNKIAVILNWKFFAILKILKIYLEFIEWLRDYVVWYAQKAKLLQERKTMLLKNSSSHKEFVRKAYFFKIVLKNSTDRERKFFELIQAAFKNSQFLTHFNLIHQFLIDVNVFKEEFEVFVYHIKKEREEVTKSTAIESIVFLSKILISVKKRYWLIELEIVAVVWVVKKLHHMIRAFKHLTIIWIDHSATTSIVKQIKLITSNSDKLNLRLVWVDMYLSQFDLDIRHKSEKDHVISDALSRLSAWNDDEEKITKISNSNILDDIDAYFEILVKMSSQFKNRLVQNYKTDKQWSALYEMLVVVSSTQTTRREIISIVTGTPGSLLVPPGTPSFLKLPGRKKKDEVLVLVCCSP